MEILNWLQLYWGPLVLALITAALFVVAWRHQPGNVGGAAAQLLAAAQVAQELVRGAEQAWKTGKIERDERYEIVIDHLHGLFPGLSVADLNAIVEAAVYGMNEIKRLPLPAKMVGVG
jgi:hypothetical protein